jgi:hypothetical protein
MGVDADSTVTIGHWVDRLTGPAARAESFSAAEVLDRAAMLREMHATLPPAQQRAVLDQLPRGYAEGFEALAARFQAGKERLASSQLHRLRLLERAEDLPYLAYEELLRHTAKTVFAASTESELIAGLSPGTAWEKRSETLTEARTALRLIKFLLVLSLAGKPKFPTALTPVLLFLLLEVLSVAKDPTAAKSQRRKPERALRPPGRDLRSNPRAARAPGCAVPLAVLNSEGLAGLRAFGGTL